MRPARSALTGSFIYTAAGLLWVILARPQSAPGLVTWIVGLGVAGLFLPGWANQVTMARAYLSAPAFVYSTRGDNTGLGLLAATVAVAGLSDVLDGRVARRLARETRLGGGLDPIVDGLFFGGVAVGLAVARAYPAWLAGVVVVRYLLPAAIGTVLLVGGHDPHLHHTPLGQMATTVIAVMLGGVALLRGLGQDPSSLILVGEIAIPAASLLAFANLYQSNRSALLRSQRGPDA